MLTAQDNELLTRVGPGTPGGELMRRYWHPIAAVQQLDQNPVRKVKILGEELALYRDRSGTLGLLGLRCPHRLMSLQYGIPEERGLRCAYHGWLFDEEGRCIETPLEPPDSTFKEKVQTLHYPVQEMGGLVWAYLGPAPVPLLPRWDLFVRPGGFRQIVAHRLPCNWLQVMENRGDLGHAVYLHGRLAQYALERQGRLTDDNRARYNATMRQQQDKLDKGVYTRYQPVWNQFGFTKGNLESDKSEDEPSWTIGTNSFLFPYTLTFAPYAPGTIRKSYQIGVPLDDTNTWHFQYFYYDFPPGVNVPEQHGVPYADVPLDYANGEPILDNVLSQDMIAWWSQGEIADRTQEHLGVSDALVIAYRNLLKEQIKVVQDGGEPMNVFRDPSTIERPERLLEQDGETAAQVVANRGPRGSIYYRANFHKVSKGGWLYIDDDVDRYCPDRDTIVQLYRETEELQLRQAQGA
ncbi:MAG: Rieske 2Fe-2S domain-containing protein [Chloroflexota bacterium]|nr:Rieske 2Fe-2S domain-containing protein [Chloroflexota bacterium]MDE2884058.1 Rieske 2Fe-2S domain-containing protein [Chloroflexota bacterium]